MKYHEVRVHMFFIQIICYKAGQTEIFYSTGLVSFSQWIHLEAKDHDLEFVQTVLYFRLIQYINVHRSTK